MVKKDRDWLETAELISKIFAAIAVPFLILIFGYYINSKISTRQANAQLVQVAVDILREDPSKNTPSMRKWSAQVISAYSDIHLSEEQINDLEIGTVRIPIPEIQLIYDENGKLETIRGADGSNYNPFDFPYKASIPTEYDVDPN